MRIRYVFSVALVSVGIMVGCSDNEASKLTPEQKAALQALGEMMDCNSEAAQGDAAHNALRARSMARFNATEDCEPSSKEFKDAVLFIHAVQNLSDEYFRRRKTDGLKQAADWIVQEARKSDSQLAREWGGVDDGPGD